MLLSCSLGLLVMLGFWSPIANSQQMPGGVGGVIIVGDPVSSSSSMGDISDLQNAFAAGIKQQYINKTGYLPANFKLVAFTRQIVAGTNYFTKVQLCVNDYAHLWVFRPLNYPSQPMQLMSAVNGKYLGDPIDSSELRNSGQPVPILGGLDDVVSLSDSDLAEANSDTIAHLQDLLRSTVKTQFTQTTGVQPSRFNLISYATQVVAGTNYFAKVQISDQEYVHLAIYEPLFGSVQLLAVQRQKSLSDPISYFDNSPSQNVQQQQQQMPGGLGQITVVNDSLSATPSSNPVAVHLKSLLVPGVRDVFAQQVGFQPCTFYLISYATQVVSGTNYFAKVRISSQEYVHFRIYEPLSVYNQQTQLTGYQRGQTASDPVLYF